ncbi:hypothetical protein [Terrabacter terrigena]|uniref:Uncharacterized protein n=1 Tax=Terrabacter terrigena TaxID=574718 RepID=A0ABW3MV94_9MICO
MADDEHAASRVANPVSAAVVALGVLVYVGLAVRTGLTVGDAAASLAALLVTQVLPGVLVWRSLRPRAGWLLEDLAAGFAIGSALAVPVQIVAGLTHQRWLAAALPVALVLLLVGLRTPRRRILEARWQPVAWWFAPVTAVVSLAAVPQFLDYTVSNRVAYAGPTAPHIDTYLHQALASELLTRGPVSWPTVAGEDLGYHWFTHAWLAQVSAASGVELDAVLTRVMPALMPMAVVLAVAVAGLRLGGRSWVGAAAALVTMFGGRFNAFEVPDLAFPLTPLSPTLALGAPTLLLLVTVLALRWRGEMLRGAWVLVPLLAVVSAGTKGSTAPLVVAGLAVAVAAMALWNRRLLVPTLVDLLVVGAGLVFALIVVFHGSSAGLKLGATDAAKQSLLAGLLTQVPSVQLVWLAVTLGVVSGMSRAALTFVLPFHEDTRRDPLTWVLIGSTFAAACAVALFSHPGRSQGYFYLTAIPLAALGSVLGLQRLARSQGARAVGLVAAAGIVGGLATYAVPTLVAGHLRPRAYSQAWETVWLAAGCLAAVAVIGVVAAWLSTRRRPRENPRRPGAGVVVLASVAASLLVAGSTTGVLALKGALTPVPTKPVTLRSPNAVSQGQIDVARYIRDHSGVDDLVMTNRHCTVPRQPFGGCDSRRWIVTAFSERQALVEGWTATPEATRVAPHGRDSITVDYWKPDILRLNDRFTRTPDVADQKALWDLGVRWVYLENTMPHAQSLAPYAEERFRTADASAWQLSTPSAP